jgi:hypothetical protein
MKKLIAKTLQGQEYLHSKKDVFFASANAQKIADVLNKNKYKITESEKWHVYDYDFMQDYYTQHRIFITNKGQIKYARI